MEQAGRWFVMVLVAVAVTGAFTGCETAEGTLLMGSLYSSAAPYQDTPEQARAAALMGNAYTTIGQHQSAVETARAGKSEVNVNVNTRTTGSGSTTFSGQQDEIDLYAWSDLDGNGYYGGNSEHRDDFTLGSNIMIGLNACFMEPGTSLVLELRDADGKVLVFEPGSFSWRPGMINTRLRLDVTQMIKSSGGYEVRGRGGNAKGSFFFRVSE